MNGIDRTDRIRWRTLSIDKDGAMETCQLDAYDPSGSFRLVEGDALRVLLSGGLEFGGEVFTAREVGIDRGTRGPVTSVRAKGWAFEAGDVKVWGRFPAQPAYARAAAVLTQYLAPKGWTNIGPTTGGDLLPAVTYAGETVAAILDDITEAINVPWRVNGDRQFAYVLPGSLLAPVDFVEGTGSVVHLGVSVGRSQTRKASRLFLTTGGSGTVTHTETHIASGAETHFPVHVLPSAGQASLTAAAAAGATSLALRGLPASYTLKAGVTLTFGAHGAYTLGADATTDADGAVTVTLSSGLTQAAEAGEAVTLDASAFVRLQVNGVDTPLGGEWTWNADEARFAKTGALPAAGTQVTYIAVVTLPVIVRVWTADTRDVWGQWNYANVRDTDLTDQAQTDISAAITWATNELAKRNTVPRQVQLTTYAQGLYPWQRATLDIPSRQATGPYLVGRVRLVDDGLRDRPRVEVTLLEGDAIGPDWREFFRGQPVRGGVGGSATVGSVSSGSGGGSATLPAGTTVPLGGDNAVSVLAATTWQDVPQAIPVRLGGAGMAGTWLLRVPLYQLSAGTVEARLLDQTTGTALATVASTATGAYIDNSFFAFPSVSFTAPAGVDDVLLQVRVTSGTREVVVGKATVVKV